MGVTIASFNSTTHLGGVLARGGEMQQCTDRHPQPMAELMHRSRKNPKASGILSRETTLAALIFTLFAIVPPVLFAADGEALPENPSSEPGVETTELEAVEDATESSLAASFTKDVLFKLLVAELAGRRGQPALAAEYYLDAARETRDPVVAERAIRVAVFAKDEARSLAAAKLWTELDPDNESAVQIHAALLLRAGRVDESIAELRTLLAGSEPPSPEAWGLVSDILVRESDRAAAVQVMERLVADHEGDPLALLSLAQLAARADDMAKAVELAKRVQSIDPGNEQALMFYARVLQRQGKTEDALKALREGVDAKPDSEPLRTTYARMLVDAKRYDDARAQFERLVEATPENAEIRYALGLLLLQTERFEDALQQFEKLVELRQRVPLAYYYIGQIEETQKNYDEALAAYRRVDRGEQYLSAQLRVAVLLAEQGHLEKARNHLHGLPQRNANEAVRVYRAEAEILSNKEQLEDAMAVYDTALDAYPKNGEILYARAMLAERMDRLDVVERDLRDILSREPDNANALNALGYTLADRTDRYDEALVLIKRALALKPDDHYIVDSMGWVLYRLGRYTEAVAQLRRAMELSGDAEVAAHLGEVLWVKGEKQEAKEVWDNALEAAPGDERILDVMKRLSH